VRQRAEKRHHGNPVGVAAEDAESPQDSARRSPISTEDAVASEEEVQAASGRQERWTQVASFHEGNRQEAKIAIRIEGEPWCEHGT